MTEPGGTEAPAEGQADRAGPPGTASADRALIDGLRRGDETVFAQVVRQYHSSLVRVAQSYVSSTAVAEEVVQETWLAVVKGIDRFEGRSSFKTWLYRILTYQARSRGEREKRSTPVSSLTAADGAAGDGGGPRSGGDEGHYHVALERFRGSDALWAGHWAAPPRRWEGEPEGRALDGETRRRLELAIDLLPTNQREVLVLRDVSGLSSAEVCELLDLSEGNQRVLLHRARSRVRASLEDYFDTR